MQRFKLWLRRWLGVDACVDAIGLLDKTIVDEMRFRGQFDEQLSNRLDIQEDKTRPMRCEIDRILARESEIIAEIGKLQRQSATL